MAKIRMLITFYLTVAVMVSVALMPFAAGSAETDFLYNDITVENSQADENAGSVSSDEEAYDKTLSENCDINIENTCPEEKVTEDASEFFSEDVTESSLNETATGGDVPSEPETEIKTEEEQSVNDYEETEKETGDTGFIAPELYDSYVPSQTNEKVYDLYFLSSNIGALDSADAINTYTFLLENRAMFSFSVTHKELMGLQGWEVSLYGEYYINGDGGQKGYRLISTLVTSSAAGKEVSAELGLSAGEYRLVVTKAGAYTSEKYQIDVKYKDTSGYEIECNDNIYRYTEVFSGVPVKGSASYFTDRQDEDYYMFRMYEDGFAELKFSHPSVKDKATVCWQVIFFSEDGKELYSVNSLFTDEMNYSGAIGLDAGNYFVVVRNRVYTDITYTLNISRTDDRSYEKEKNDTSDTANVISLNSTVIGSVSLKTGTVDKDWFAFDIEKTGCVMLELAHEPIDDENQKAGWNYTLIDSKGEILFTGVSLWTDDVVSTPEIGLGGGIYYILIDSEGIYHNSAEYYLTVNFVESDEWESEYNNTFNRADRLQASVPIFGFLSECGVDYDFDCYTFTLSEKTDVTVAFSHEKLSYSKNIFTFTLYDADEKAVADSEGNKIINIGADKESVTAAYKDLAPGKYYIKVGTGHFFDLIRYNLCYSTGDAV